MVSLVDVFSCDREPRFNVGRGFFLLALILSLGCKKSDEVIPILEYNVGYFVECPQSCSVTWIWGKERNYNIENRNLDKGILVNVGTFETGRTARITIDSKGSIRANLCVIPNDCIWDTASSGFVIIERKF